MQEAQSSDSQGELEGASPATSARLCFIISTSFGRKFVEILCSEDPVFFTPPKVPLCLGLISFVELCIHNEQGRCGQFLR
jgi:hypothetical protein